MQPDINRDEDVERFFYLALQKVYWAENNIVLLLGKIKNETFSPHLQNTVARHEGQTAVHAERLRKLFISLGQQVDTKKCEAFNGILKDATATLLDTKRKTRSRDLGILSTLLKIKHYQIASYTMLLQLCSALGWGDVAGSLKQSLEDEYGGDKEIRQIIR